MRLLLSISLAIGVLSCFGPWIAARDPFVFAWFVLLLVPCWLVVFMIGLFKFGRGGLWLLIGFPFVLLWPYIAYRIRNA
jgi:hypothetical protein